MLYLLFYIVGEVCKLWWVIICDYVKNIVLQWINGGDFGLVFDDMNWYIVYDVGVVGVMEYFSYLMDVLVVMLNFFCFVIDFN